tara:strand:- start:525 stop:1277 length:753 start_codon:yes stop_codon:yes gene_type:complete
MNKNFLYGDITVRFLRQIKFRPEDKFLLDIGCGTGFIFDVLYDNLKAGGIQCFGIEPASGMLKIAERKYKHGGLFSVGEGSFEKIPFKDRSFDRILSTLALHWVKSLEVAALEMRRVLKDTGQIDILMIAKDDGDNFKKYIVNALRKHLNFSQIMKTATLVQRVNAQQLEKTFYPFHNDFDIEIKKINDLVYGTFDEHMKWWKARSSPVIAEVKDKAKFMQDLREEMEKINSPQGIPFDTAYFCMTIRRK